MTRALAVVVCGATLLLVGCKEKPEVAYERMVFNAKMGNEAAFLDAFTKDSRKLVKAILELRRTYGDDVNKDADPYLSLVLDEVVETNIDTQKIRTKNADEVERRVATMTVAKGPLRRQIRMIEFDDGWKIDAFDLQALWNDRKAYISKE